MNSFWFIHTIVHKFMYLIRPCTIHSLTYKIDIQLLLINYILKSHDMYQSHMMQETDLEWTQWSDQTTSTWPLVMFNTLRSATYKQRPWSENLYNYSNIQINRLFISKPHFSIVLCIKLWYILRKSHMVPIRNYLVCGTNITGAFVFTRIKMFILHPSSIYVTAVVWHRVCVCVCVCARAGVRARARSCMHSCIHACMHACM